MRMRAVLPVLVILLMVAVVSGCAKKEEPKPVSSATTASVGAMEEGKALFEKKCGVCHPLDRATSRTESRERWASIIKEMKEKRTGWISDEDAVMIRDYLTSSHGK